MRRLSITLAVLLAMAVPAAAEPLKVRETKSPVAQVVERLEKAIEAKGLKVAAKIDHAAGAKAAGMTMAPTVVVVFGNPKLGTALMQANPQIGVDLPLKILVWEAAPGRTMIGYTAPDVLKARFDIKDKDPMFKAMGEALEGFATAAAGQ